MPLVVFLSVDKATSSTLKATFDASPEAHVNLPSKVDATAKPAADTEKPSKLVDDKEIATLSHASLELKAKTKTLTLQVTSYLAIFPAMFTI